VATASKFGVDFHNRRRAVLGAVASTVASIGFNAPFRLRPMPATGRLRSNDRRRLAVDASMAGVRYAAAARFSAVGGSDRPRSGR